MRCREEEEEGKKRQEESRIHNFMSLKEWMYNAFLIYDEMFWRLKSNTRSSKPRETASWGTLWFY